LQAQREQLQKKFQGIGLDRSSFIRWDDFLRLADYLFAEGDVDAKQDTVTATYTEVLEKDLRKKKKKTKKKKKKERPPLKDLGSSLGEPTDAARAAPTKAKAAVAAPAKRWVLVSPEDICKKNYSLSRYLLGSNNQSGPKHHPRARPQESGGGSATACTEVQDNTAVD
jgi:hypothetical protein